MTRGLILEPIQPDDFIFGADRSLATKFGGEVLNSTGDWRGCVFNGLPSHQAPGFETQSCVTHGTLNAFELLLKVQYDRTQDFSDRFLAKVGGTDPERGASPKQIGEAFRKKFAVQEKLWPTLDARTTAEFYADIPPDLMMLAIGEGAEWDCGYEYVGTSKAALKEALKYSPVGISVPAWTKDENKEYYRPEGMTDNHWVCLLHIDEQGRFHILDSYDPFTKILRADFSPTVAMRYYLTRQVVHETPFKRFIKLIRSLWTGRR